MWLLKELKDALNCLDGEFHLMIMYKRTTFVSHTFSKRPYDYINRVARKLVWERAQNHVSNAYDDSAWSL